MTTSFDRWGRRLPVPDELPPHISCRFGINSRFPAEGEAGGGHAPLDVAARPGGAQVLCDDAENFLVEIFCGFVSHLLINIAKYQVSPRSHVQHVSRRCLWLQLPCVAKTESRLENVSHTGHQTLMPQRQGQWRQDWSNGSLETL